jgi:hypothetical protein
VTGPTGPAVPFRTREQAAAAASRALLLGSCEAAGVHLGEYDVAALDGLAHGDPAVCAAVASIIIRAYHAGKHPVPQSVRTDLDPYAYGVTALETMRQLAAASGARAVPTADVLAGLDGPPLTGRQLAALVAPYGAAPVKIKAGGRSVWGYRAEHVAAALARLDHEEGAA